MYIGKANRGFVSDRLCAFSVVSFIWHLIGDISIDLGHLIKEKELMR